MTARYHFAALDGADPSPEIHEFDCGDADYNRWLTDSAPSAVRAGAVKVYLLLESTPDAGTPSIKVVGYFAIAPTTVARAELPRAASGGAPDPVLGFLLAKLALDRSFQGDRNARWGTQLVLGALRRIVNAAEIGGGRVVAVDADNEGLLGFYRAHSFLPTKVDPLRLYMKVATARRLIADHDRS